MSFLKTQVDINTGHNPTYVRQNERAAGETSTRINTETSKNKIPKIPRSDEEKESKSSEEDNIFSAAANFLSRTGIKITTFSSIALNLVSAPLRIISGDNPIKKLINKASMFATRAHMAVYSLAGINSAIKQKNPLWLFSFATEMLISFMGNLRNIYEARGLATAADAIPPALEKLLGGTKFDSYTEGFTKSLEGIKQTVKEMYKDPSKLNPFNPKNERHILVGSSIVTTVAALFGLTVNDKIGGSIRDISGMFGDVGLALKPNRTVKTAGYSYLFGSLVDLTARGFTNGLSIFFPPSVKAIFERVRDGLHELAIALDRMGQFLFLGYIQENEAAEKAAEEFQETYEPGGATV